MRARILYVEDDQSNREVFAAAFGKQFDVTVFSSGAEALAEVERCHPSVVVVDQRMPGMTGVEVLERVREISPATERVVLSAWEDEEVERHNGSGTCGCVQQHFMKPFERESFSAALMIADLKSRAAATRAEAERVCDRAVARRVETDALHKKLLERISRGE